MLCRIIVHPAPEPIDCEAMRLSARNLRITAAIAIAGAVVWSIAPYATSYVSSQAVVNAPLNTVLSPLQGRITQRSPPAGASVVSGIALVAIEVEERDRRYLEDLRARLALLDESHASAEDEAAKLALMEDVLMARIRNYRTRTLARLTTGKREVEAALVACEMMPPGRCLEATARSLGSDAAEHFGVHFGADGSRWSAYFNPRDPSRRLHESR